MEAKTKAIEKQAPKFVELISKRLLTISEDWEQPFFSIPSNSNFMPQNIRGTKYKASNAFFLFLLCEEMNYQTPVFLTFNQAKDLNVSINKGSKSFPVKYKSFTIMHRETKEKITINLYRRLTEAEQKEYMIFSMLKYYNVFNIENTNYPTEHPKEWEEMIKKYDRNIVIDSSIVGEKNTMLEDMLEHKKWLCNIELKHINKAYYSSRNDKIVLPLKEQFKDYAGFYSTLLHEMSHSTGHCTRLNRNLGNSFGSVPYAHEELIAEISAIITGLFTGVSVTIREQNVAYIASWLQKFKSDPLYLHNVIEDATKASTLICEEVGVIEELEEIGEQEEKYNKRAIA